MKPSAPRTKVMIDSGVREPVADDFLLQTPVPNPGQEKQPLPETKLEIEGLHSSSTMRESCPDGLGYLCVRSFVLQRVVDHLP